MMLWVLWCLSLSTVYGVTDFFLEYPNPQVKWRLCGQQKASYICDPNFILDRGDVEKLEMLAKEMKTSTKCLCSACPEDTNVQIGIFIKYNHSKELTVENPGNNLAEMIRKTWHLGACDDDIIIVLVTQLNITGFSLGSSVQTILPEATAAQILQDCQVHFNSGYFYQGLESIVNSFNDIIIREQKKSSDSYRELLIGLLIGFAVLLVITSCAFAFHFRQVKRRKKSCSNIYEKDVHQRNRMNRPDVDEQLERLNKKSEMDSEDV
ncbi:uncharacterized protein [Parasteatoda tepidariorum]|uniref:uncharacterized protein n=1 Tax=Parasteatoda tepidariorum TaxID=114398 RepID=UPI001C71B433|nr:uncharacterized protein LOC107442500 [Parasteatoda tepidariorum]XP_042908136.1 uncharacterized protein LOC107442500 [Parasteatoda tepidariorum]XP_042908137.1 uncharacterized protein LOC107442500 [Parasteatoda tepidariorum]